MAKILRNLFISFISILCLSIPAMSYSPFSDEVERKYGVNSKCEVCHSPSGLNSFGQEFKNLWLKDKKSLSKHLELLEKLDTDGDGYSNFEELRNETFPADKFSKPKNEKLKSNH